MKHYIKPTTAYQEVLFARVICDGPSPKPGDYIPPSIDPGAPGGGME